MTTYAINTATEKKDKKKSMRIAMVIHVLAALLLLIPIASQIELDKAPAHTQVVLIDFNDFKAASAKSSTKAGAAEAAEETKEPAEEKTKAAEAADPKPEKPVNPVKAAPVSQTKKPAKIKTKPKAKPAPPKKKAEPVKNKPKVQTKAPSKTSKPKGQKGKTGVGAMGNSTTGDSKTNGKVDKGKQGMDFEGEALFTRRVIRRAEIKQLSKKKGTIVINLCVNQNGSVVYAEFNKADSNIYDASLAKEAIQATYKYRFEPDYTAPVKQCGKLTYIIKIK